MIAFSEMSYPVYDFAPFSISLLAKNPDPQPSSMILLFLIRG